MGTDVTEKPVRHISGFSRSIATSFSRLVPMMRSDAVDVTAFALEDDDDDDLGKSWVCLEEQKIVDLEMRLESVVGNSLSVGFPLHCATPMTSIFARLAFGGLELSLNFPSRKPLVHYRQQKLTESKK